MHASSLRSHSLPCWKPGEAWEGGVGEGPERRAQSPERKAQAPPQPGPRTPLQPGHLKTVGHTAPQGHRNRATLHNLPPRCRAPARHPPCGARAALRGPTAGEPEWGAGTAGTRNGDARDRELGTEGLGGGDGGDSEREEEAGMRRSGSRVGERNHGAGPRRSAPRGPDPGQGGLRGEGSPSAGPPRPPYTGTRPT